ncbi:MAG TPA: lysine-sensitive aspartokinase 3 [Vicinamibacterales bacterium]|nr:lysine-sensitive aspartokinase 3 [Vicinamibacterales bacterium]
MVVQKFGGTSVADPAAIRRLIEIVRTARARDGHGPAVVVSAMSGVTDVLLGIASAAGSGAGTEEALTKIEQLRQRHLTAAGELAATADQEALATDINATLDQLAAVARALAVLREVSPRTLDVIAAMGELLSSRLVAAALNAAGVEAQWVDARRAIVTSGDHTRATPLTVETARALRATVVAALDAKRVPVLGGFVGATVDGHTTTLGRGGSDYSGALVGAGIGAREIQIWTDVDGMLTADPRVIAKPRLVPRLSFAEAAELAYFGAKVLHPSTILPAVERDIPVRILNSLRPEGSGTLITAEPSLDGSPLTGLASKRNVIVVDITSTRMLMAYGFLRRVFEVFERFSTAVDVVTTSEVSVSVTVDDPKSIAVITEALSEFAEVSTEREMALLCAVGDRLRDEPEIAARVVSVLEEVPLRMISQAASRRNITVVLRQADLAHAMQRLHEEFFR